MMKCHDLIIACTCVYTVECRIVLHTDLTCTVDRV